MTIGPLVFKCAQNVMPMIIYPEYLYVNMLVSEIHSCSVYIFQRCPSHQQFTIIGRAVQDQCLQCCSHDGCNKDLCEVQDISGTQ